MNANPELEVSYRRVDVCGWDDVPDNGNKAFLIEGLSILICKSASELYAVENRCSHNSSPLEGGRVRGHALFCPVHGARFDLRDGSTAGALTRTSIKTFRVERTSQDFIAVILPI